jgi:hypothetical protein
MLMVTKFKLRVVQASLLPANLSSTQSTLSSLAASVDYTIDRMPNTKRIKKRSKIPIEIYCKQMGTMRGRSNSMLQSADRAAVTCNLSAMGMWHRRWPMRPLEWRRRMIRSCRAGPSQNHQQLISVCRWSTITRKIEPGEGKKREEAATTRACPTLEIERRFCEPGPSKASWHR